MYIMVKHESAGKIIERTEMIFFFGMNTQTTILSNLKVENNTVHIFRPLMTQGIKALVMITNQLYTEKCERSMYKMCIA